MPVKTDGAGKRWVEMEFLTPGTPEQVWQAMATGPGNSAWFTKTTIEERVGGSIRFEFGPEMASAGEVTLWEPPHRFGYVEREWSEGAPPVATEITITSRSGDRCVVRMVHSLFSTSDDWDDQMEGFEAGWPGFFEILRLYLAHFAGQKAASFQVMTSVESDQAAVWKRLLDSLGLAAADAGDRWTAPAQPESLSGTSGTIARIQQDAKQRYILLRLEEPVPGIAILGTYNAGERTNASLYGYFYGEGAEARVAASEPKWRDWISALGADGTGL